MQRPESGQGGGNVKIDVEVNYDGMFEDCAGSRARITIVSTVQNGFGNGENADGRLRDDLAECAV